MLDYDDLLLFWHALLADPAAGARGARALRPRARRRVPGHQRAAGRDRRACCARTDAASPCVGDDAQAIYRFRAATVRNILDFPELLPRRRRSSRSSRTTAARSRILAATNAVIAEAAERHDKALWTRAGRRRAARARHLPRRGRADATWLVRARPRAPRGGHGAAAAGGALPRRAPLPGARARARAPQHPVPQVRRAASSSRRRTSRTSSRSCGSPRTRAT